ncbi:hypothetical protein BDD43_1632 [Mucilaginibacter gracilis]|uniref:Uncharacterized protein n=1 Tax=Mucilaginibacter gracilis TaxID=423350 RepID=A0A495IXR7_9SPHI|nr:DUF6515 family protein [Mucilaginibacter gracilis]RKR81485.1 hypothetical protein BDD43_1632 [Mucilaginibacter gracilis]
MKNILKNATSLSIAGLLLCFMSNANAQRRGGGARLSIGIRGGFGFGYRSYHRPYYGGFGFGYPAIGLSFGYLPYGYFPFYYGPDLYYGYNGIYYRQNSDSYEVVAPPVGAEVPKLPPHAKSLMIDGQQYYELNGVYYKEVIHQDGTKGYVIAGKDGVLTTDKQQDSHAPQVGDVVDQLPQDSREVNIAGKKYFVSPDDVYYQETVDNGGSTSYKVVGVPADQNQTTRPPAPPQIQQQ